MKEKKSQRIIRMHKDKENKTNKVKEKIKNKFIRSKNNIIIIPTYCILP